MEQVTMKTVVFFQPATGRIMATASQDTASLAADTRSWLEVGEFKQDYDQTHYVVEGVLTPRPAMAISHTDPVVPANGMAEVIITGVPAGVDVSVTGPGMFAVDLADGSPIHLTFTATGQYTVRASQFPFLDHQVVCHAV